MPQVIYGAQRAEKTLAANLTPRYVELDNLQAYVEGRQYIGLAHWLTENDVPLLERAPCIVDPIAESAIESYVDLVFGEGRFPVITSALEDGAEPITGAFALSEDDSASLDTLIQRICEHADVEEKTREAYARGLGERSAVAIVCVKQGQLVIDLERAKYSTPKFDKETGELVELEIRYPYIESYWHKRERRHAQRCMLFRRVIDTQNDTTFQPIEAHPTGEPPDDSEWIVDVQIPHRFGFCPAIWYAHRKISTVPGDIDGVSLHERQLDEIDALNRTLSQRHRAGLNAGDPQIVEIGVDKDHNPAPTGVPAEGMRLYKSELGGSPDFRRAQAAWRVRGGATGAVGVRRKGPGVIWRYEGKKTDTSVEYLKIDADTLEPLDTESHDRREQIAEAFSWVRTNPSAMRGNKSDGVNLTSISGKALAWMYKRQTAQCDTERPDVWRGWLYPLVDMLLRVALAYAREPARGGLYIGGIDKLPALLGRFEATIAGRTGTRWFRPMLRPKWGAYFKPTEADQKLVSDQVKQDFEGGLITKKTAVQRLSEFYPEINEVGIDEYLEELETEQAERADEEMNRTVEETTAIHKAVADDGPVKPRSPKKPKKASRK